MVQVYLAEIPDKERGARAQSGWARKLLDMALKRQYPEISGPVLLERDDKGKPFLLEYPQIHINFSHSGGYVACAIGEKPVGVDIESHKRRSRQELVVKKFHPKEREAYQAADAAQKELLFHELWVLKESFMKAEGSGLGIPLDSFYMEGICRERGRVQGRREDRTYYYKRYLIEGRELSLAACSEEAVFSEEPVWMELVPKEIPDN